MIYPLVRELAATGPLIIGGKSMGGRVASMVADELFKERRIAGLFSWAPLARRQPVRGGRVLQAAVVGWPPGASPAALAGATAPLLPGV